MLYTFQHKEFNYKLITRRDIILQHITSPGGAKVRFTI